MTATLNVLDLCETTVFDSLGPLVQPAINPLTSTSITIEELQDSVSKVHGLMDGITQCGQRKYTISNPILKPPTATIV